MFKQTAQLLTVSEAARILRMSPDAVRRWVRTGALPAMRIGPGGPYRIRLEDLVAYVNRQDD